VGFNPIYLDASSITKRANPFVKASTKFRVVLIYFTTISLVFLKCLTDLICCFTCLENLVFSFALPTIAITFDNHNAKEWLVLVYQPLASHSRALSDSVSVVADSSATSSTSIVNFVRIVCLRDLQETTAPPIVNIYPLVALISAASEI
jgi:hypothetical protein